MVEAPSCLAARDRVPRFGAITILALPAVMPFYLVALAHHICRVSGIADWRARFRFSLLLGALTAAAWLPLLLPLFLFSSAIGAGDT